MNFKIVNKFIKEINFKIPSVKTFIQLENKISDYNIKIDIKSSQVKDKILEVNTSLSLVPMNKLEDKIETNITYAAIIEFTGELPNKEELEKIILIKIPSELYTDLRKIFLNIFESSGFKGIKIGETVDFEKLYQQRKVQ